LDERTFHSQFDDAFIFFDSKLDLYELQTDKQKMILGEEFESQQNSKYCSVYGVDTSNISTVLFS